jgi:hypothetical protein
MSRHFAGRVGRGPIPYRIVVRGELRGSLEGLVVRSEGGFSVITGEIVDQSHLHGILDWLGVRGVEIMSVSVADGSEK